MIALERRLDRIESKLDRALAPRLPAVLSVKEAMQELGCRSASAFYRRTARLGIKPFFFGQYRREDIENAKGRAALTKR